MANALVSVLLTPLVSRSAIIAVSLNIAFLMVMLPVAEPLWDGSLAFKLHLVINDRGELLNVKVTRGNTDDRKLVVELLQNLFGKVFADKGYISKPLMKELRTEYNVILMAKPRRNMKNHLMLWQDKLLARKRSLVETVIEQLKNISQIEHSRHRSPANFCVNLLCGLIAYCHQPKKPSLHLDDGLSLIQN